MHGGELGEKISAESGVLLPETEIPVLTPPVMRTTGAGVVFVGPAVVVGSLTRKL